jgi:hypothetical protein
MGLRRAFGEFSGTGGEHEGTVIGSQDMQQV